MTFTPGTKIGPYEILAPLGAGGMGEVYRAHDAALGRDLALKVLPPETMADETARARLVREARTASSLNHPHIAHIYEVGEDRGHLFIAMELVEGHPLRDLIAAGGLTAETVLAHGVQIADAVAYAHQRGVIHRDLKSANVMVAPDGWVKVLDFGLARRFQDEATGTKSGDLSLTAAGTVVGTPYYLPPEVILGAKADARSDVWALGVVLYEMAMGRLPFQGESVVELADAIVNAAPSPISGRVSIGLKAVIERCLAKNPAERFQNGGEVRAALLALNQGGKSRPAAGAARRLWISAGVLLLAAAGVAAVAFGIGEFRKRGGPPPGPPRISSLAVLPLANLSGDPGQEYFADGMTEELITDLASIKALKVISRTSAMRFKGSKKALREIAKELDVEGIVEGSVLRAGDRVRITAQLIEAASDRHLWARSYERAFSDVLTLQSEVAQDIAKEIRLHVAFPEGGRSGRRRRVDPEAYDLYLKGRYEWGQATEESVRKSIEYFERARAIDPGDARYSSGLADAALVLTQMFSTMPTREGMAQVKAHARDALAADAESPEAHASMGAALFFGDWNWTEAEKHLRRSIELNPGYPTSRLVYSVFLGAAGRFNEAMEQDRVALDLDPLSLMINWNAAGTLAYAHRFDDALAQAKRTLQLEPGSMVAQSSMLRVYEHQRDYGAAIDILERYLPEEDGGKAFVAKLRKAYAASGEAGYWRALLAAATGPKGESLSPPDRMAMFCAQLGDRKRAIDYLERAFAEHSADILFINVDPGFDPLRSEPRFQALVLKIGLTPRS